MRISRPPLELDCYSRVVRCFPNQYNSVQVGATRRSVGRDPRDYYYYYYYYCYYYYYYYTTRK